MTQLLCQFEKAEAQRARIQNAARALSEAQWRWSSGADEWSAAQIVEHLMLSDATIGKVVENPKPPRALFRLIPARWRLRLVIQAFGRDIRLPLPSPDVEPKGSISASELCNCWEESQLELRSVLTNVTENTKQQASFFHPVIGPMTATQMMDLNIAHRAYHERQMQRLIGLVQFPKF